VTAWIVPFTATARSRRRDPDAAPVSRPRTHVRSDGEAGSTLAHVGSG
jgi:hypothetical protein